LPFLAWPGGQKPRLEDGVQLPFFSCPGGQKLEADVPASLDDPDVPVVLPAPLPEGAVDDDV